MRNRSSLTWVLMGDRKSTRLNSSHSQISYAAFCLKKKHRSDLNSAHPACTLRNCSITENNFAQNTNLAIKIVEGNVKDNLFFLNNFTDNNNGSLHLSITWRF